MSGGNTMEARFNFARAEFDRTFFGKFGAAA